MIKQIILKEDWRNITHTINLINTPINIKGVVREVKEETGLDVMVDKITGIYNKPKQNNIIIQFFCKIIGNKLKLNAEADIIEYFALGDIPKNIVPKQVERIKDFFDNPNKIYIKNQTGEHSKTLVDKGLL